MKRLILLPLILCLCAAAAAYAQTSPAKVDWYWSAPVQYTDNSAIPSGVTITYDLYVGTNGPGSESTTPAQRDLRYLSAVTSGYLQGQKVCGFVTAILNGIESPHSSEVCGTIPAATPGAPTNLVLKVNP